MRSRLFLIALLACVFLYLLEFLRKSGEDPLLDVKVKAARKMQEAMNVLKEEKLRRGLVIDKETDPNMTGMIGKDYTDLTTTLGPLSSKRTSTNPNFAGVIVEMLAQVGVRRGDPVAVSLSGSFPALNVALFSACSSLELRPVIISSVGASTYGANEPEFTWLDMEKVLRIHHLFPYRSVAASLGGLIETRGGIGGKGIEMGREAICRHDIQLLDEQGIPTLARDIERRLFIYEEACGGKRPGAFINIGGTLTALGRCPEAQSLGAGVLKPVPRSNHPLRGIIFRMGEKGAPVIHLLNIKKVALEYGLPIDPIPLPSIPEGRVMRRREYSSTLALSGLSILVCGLIYLRRARRPGLLKPPVAEDNQNQSHHDRNNDQGK